ncbi:MAG: 3-dehydroquinate synthase, partial [Alphaproteobacteria bacterium]|nr:3-dehydroquinate synthase [Alphaproteobacteria bacterium]
HAFDAGFEVVGQLHHAGAAGFAGAVFHRGLRVVRLPSTVLSQDDSGVGVKNGVNAFGVKNLAGAFAPPWAVVADLDFLDSLPPRERISGMAEAVKVALIRDAAFFGWIEDNARALAAFRPGPVETLVRRSAELHLNHIGGAGDPFEFGSARPLDFGHWAAHKLESLSGNHLRHGEAVAIGMAIDTRCSVELGLLAETAAARVMRLLEALGFSLWHPALEAPRRVIEGLEEFRVHLGGRLTVTLLEDIGRGREVGALPAAVVERAIAWLERAQCP